MHYKNGRPAKVGDMVVTTDHQGVPFSGIVAIATPGSTTCNLQIAPVDNLRYHTAGDCMHIEDALHVAKPENEPAPTPTPINEPAAAGA